MKGKSAVLNRALLMVLVLLLGLSAQSCMTDIGEYTVVTGTVVYLSFEGGFYGITGDDGRHYDPINLSQDFRIDGLRVRFGVKELKGMSSYHQWGVLVEVVHIQKV